MDPGELILALTLYAVGCVIGSVLGVGICYLLLDPIADWFSFARGRHLHKKREKWIEKHVIDGTEWVKRQEEGK